MSKTVFLIAGEPSGDALGASLIKGLKAQGVTQEGIFGIGGDLMAEEGLKSLLPMQELCVMGLWEVLGQLPRLLHLIQGVVEEVEKRQPDVVVTIDLPDFNFRVAEKLKKRGIFKGKIVHYVAPTVWAWRADRAKKIAAYLDGVMCLFPFEPPYFEKHGLKAEYVGHPLIEMDKSGFDGPTFRHARGIEDSDICLGVFFGSRVRELKAHSKIFLETMDVLEEQYSNIHFIIPTLPNLEFEVLELVGSIGKSVHVVTEQNKKWDAIAACNAALAVSGTMGLELAYMGAPHAIAYKAHPLTWLILKLVVKTQYAHLANILLKDEVVPEFLQGKCSTARLAPALMELLNYPDVQNTQKEAFTKLNDMLQLEGGQTPSAKAASFVLS